VFDADTSRIFGVDQCLQDQGERLADEVGVAAGAQCIQQVGQGRLVEGVVADSLAEH
jgi:hypothetical protein